MRDIIDLIGRILICIIFFFEAYDSLAFVDLTKQTMTSYGIASHQDFWLYAANAVLILGATLVLVGYRAGFGAFLLFCYWVPITFLQHDFWNATDKDVLRELLIGFMKNMGILGGLLIVWANGSGRFSIKRLFSTTKVRNRD